MKLLVHHIVFVLLSVFTAAYGQTKVEVITKTVEDQFIYRTGETVKVEGNAAQLRIQSWDQQEVKVVMKLISKGLDRKIAQKELAYQKYVIDRINDTHVIRNYLLLPKGLEKLSTIQETVIEVWVPKSLRLEVSNRFGATELFELAGNLTIANEYGDLLLEKLNADLVVNSIFGDMKLTSYSGDLTCTLEHSTFFSDGFMGSATMKTKLGDVEWTGLQNVKTIRLEAQQSNVTFQGIQTEAYHWKVKTRFGSIQFEGQSAEKKMEVGSFALPSIDVTTDFGEIIINR